MVVDLHGVDVDDDGGDIYVDYDNAYEEKYGGDSLQVEWLPVLHQAGSNVSAIKLGAYEWFTLLCDKKYQFAIVLMIMRLWCCYKCVT